MSRPRLLDLFCGAGGAAAGYHRAGFDVVGVDITPQPHYPFRFWQGDALEFLDRWNREAFWPDEIAEEIGDFDAIHASPPCQRDTSMQAVAGNAEAHPDLIAPTRELLEQTGLPYVIENVEGARKKLRNPFVLCGSSFGLGVDGDGFWEPRGSRRELRRHRLFETNWRWNFLVPTCGHRFKTVGIYGDHLRFGRRSSDGELSGREALRMGSEAMGIDWMTWDELREAIPPAYTEFIGRRLIQYVGREAAA